MDLDIEKIHSILTEANLPSTINNLKNPTEEYIVNLINTFLRRFYIDVSAIDKVTIAKYIIFNVIFCYSDINIQEYIRNTIHKI